VASSMVCYHIGAIDGTAQSPSMQWPYQCCNAQCTMHANLSAKHPAPRGWLQGGAVGRLRHRQRCYLLPPYTCLTVPRFVLLLRRSHLDRRSTELARPTRFTDAVLTPLCGRWLSVCVSVVARPYPPKSPTADKAIAFVPQEGRTPIVVATTSSRRLYQLVQSTQ
jgi:hypothetical protein